MDYTWVKNCLACGAPDLVRTLDLGETPLANSLLTDPDGESKTYPLEVMTCTQCWHSQLSVNVEPSKLFEDYAYVSGTTETLRNHFEELAGAVLQKSQFKSSIVYILDIAANDGSLCNAFYIANYGSGGIHVSGVDPAKNLQLESFKKGIPVLVDYWTEELGQKLADTYDAITACNVFAHNNNPLGFLKGCHYALKNDGYLILEMPYCPRYMFDMPNAGHYYHEHQNYFTVRSFAKLATRAGFDIVDIHEREIHGGSIRLWLQKSKNKQLGDLFHDWIVTDYLEGEKRKGLYTLETYRRFENTLKKNWDDLARVLLSYKRQGYLIIGYGASAKSTTLLNGPFRKCLGSVAARQVIDFIIDDNPRKCGKYTPGSRIFISEIGAVKLPVSTTPKIAFLNLAYNFKDEIKEKIKRLRPEAKNDVLIEFVPRVNVSNIHEDS